jgi:hypothetical protein
MGEWRYNFTFLDLDTRWRWVVSFPTLPLYPCTHWRGGWVGPRVSLDPVEKRKILHCWEHNPGRRSWILSLYRLSHPDSPPPIQKKPPSCRISGSRSGDSLFRSQLMGYNSTALVNFPRAVRWWWILLFEGPIVSDSLRVLVDGCCSAASLVASLS